jgi:sugar O-acyltransferase (sialic acid O-acetyltransferase NeuD family)
MQKITFLGHDNASLSMLIESIYRLHGIEFNIEIVTIMDSDQLDQVKVPFLINGVECIVNSHKEWLPEADSFLMLGTMVAKIKRKIYSFFKENYNLEHPFYQNLFHPTAERAETSTHGAGCSMGPGSVLAPFASLGNQVSINRNATVGHHTNLSDFVTLNPGCNIAGYCKIGEGVTVGMGANIIDGRTVGKNSIIGAGSLVTKDIPENVVAYGVPAKVIREKEK